MQGFSYASITQGFEYTWTWLDNRWINCSDYASATQGFQHASIWLKRICLNMTKKWLDKLFWLYQGSEYAWSKIHRVLNISPVFNDRVSNMPSLWIREGYTGRWIYLNKPEYALKIPQDAWICPNKSGFAWIYLIIPE